jgi:hypothetical protein
LTRTVTVRGAGTNAFEVAGLEFPDPAVKVDLQHPEPSVYLATLVFPAGYSVETTNGPALRVRTGVEGFEEIRVPVMWSGGTGRVPGVRVEPGATTRP